MRDLKSRFLIHWKQRQFIANEKPVLLTVSGGVDSMAMAALFQQMDIPHAIAHCNFGLRGAESDGDETLVKAWAAAQNIPFFSIRFDTAAKMKEWGKGVQETARKLRYEWFEELRITHDFAAVVTAHHADDVAETVLMRLFNGTGIAGMRGIPERNGFIIRPLLPFTKKELVDYVMEKGIAYREDASNTKNDYERNAIRNRLMPVVKELYSDVAMRIQETANRLSQAEELYRNAVTKDHKRLMEQRGRDWYVPVKKLRLSTPLETLCYELFSSFGFGHAFIPQIISLLDAETGRFIASATHRIIRHRDFLVVTAIAENETDLVVVNELPVTVVAGGYQYRLSIHEQPLSISKDPDTASLDAGDITLPLLLRKAKTGDYFYPLGMARKKKKLSRFLIDQKLALHEKEKVWVVESNRRILWVAGLRPDERFKLIPATKKVLRIERKAL